MIGKYGLGQVIAASNQRGGKPGDKSHRRADDSGAVYGGNAG